MRDLSEFYIDYETSDALYPNRDTAIKAGKEWAERFPTHTFVGVRRFATGVSVSFESLCDLVIPSHVQQRNVEVFKTEYAFVCAVEKLHADYSLAAQAEQGNV